MILFAGDAEPTLTWVQWQGGELDFAADGLKDAGDMTVSRYSAVGDERFGTPRVGRLISPIPWSGVSFLSDDHLGLTNNPHFVDNMLFELLEAPNHRLPVQSSSRR